ncbi:MAG TPA: IPT/TIG domain-containing protein [Bryobacteraceae bacterium]|nr:IPT/TIG domain-containing protein [Bryobacteraceae bacterium]
MAVLQTQYQVRVGESIEVPVDSPTLSFMLQAKSRRVTIDGKDVAGLVMAPDEARDKILLAPNSKATPGTYTVQLSGASAAGDEMAVQVDVVVKPRQTVPKSATRAPVVLVNGWIAGYSGSCTISSSSSVTFGNLAQYLVQDGVPVVYLFDNCLEAANASIETLGGDLNTFLNSIQYDDGTPVTQIDVVAHSIGGLIVRAYLEGLQTNEAYLPPYSPLIHNLVMIGVPNFGSFVTGNLTTAFQAGSQGAELIPGSALLWNLATWNQRGDDLAGVNAIAVVGNAGAYATLNSTTLSNASDGFVSTTSASLGFVTPAPSFNPTRVVPYCQVDPSAWINTSLLGAFNCNAPGIANVNSTTQLTGVIVRSFLAGNTTWQTTGTSPANDQWLSTNGGGFFAMQNIQDGYATDLSAVTWGNAAMIDGGNFGTIYYIDFVSGNVASDFMATSSSLGTYNCGALQVQIGTFASYRCKLNLAISCPPGSTTCTGAVTPTTTPGTAVTSGGTLTIAGEQFGSQCASCKVYATPAGATTPTALSVGSWTNTAITVTLPSSLTGYQTLQVNGVGGVDAIGVRALAAVSAPALQLGSTSLDFAYTLGGSPPGSQSFTIANGGTGTLAWSASVQSQATWLSLSALTGTAPSTVSVTVNPGQLTAGTYTGTVTITGTGASNSPATVSVTLVVSAAPASLVVSPAALAFTYSSGGAVPAAQSLSIENAGGGSLNWVAATSADWVAVSPASGSLPGTPSVSVTPQNLPPGTNNATITIAAADNSVTPVTIPVTVTVTGTPPAPAIAGVANAGGYQTNIASATYVAIFGTNLSQLTYTWQANDFVNSALPTQIQGVSVTINGIAAYVYYVSSKQINVLAPDDPTTGMVPLVVTVAGQPSNSFMVEKNAVSPAFLTFDNTHIAAQHLNYSLLAPTSLYASATPAAPGETIILYGVGFGPTSPSVPAGQIPAGGEPLTNTVSMTIGGVPVTPSFAGLSAPGLYQFNVTVPAGLSAGDTPVVATVNGTSTQTGAVITIGQ